MNETINYKPDESGYLSQESTKSYYSRIGIFFFLLGSISFLLSLLSTLVINLFFPWLFDNGLLLLIIDYALSFISIYCIAAPVALLALSPLPKIRPIKESMKFSHLVAALCICFTFMQTGSSFSNIIITITESITGKTISNPVENSLPLEHLLTAAIFAGILFPILEELLFRRLLCNRLLPLGEKKAIIISALIFGFIHGNLYQFAYAFLLGLVLGYIYVKTGKLIYTIIFHCIINLYAGVFAQYVLSKLPLDTINEILSDETAMSDMNLLLEKLSPYMTEFALYMVYAYVMLGLSLAGFIILLVLTIKKKLTFEQGILQTPKEHRISNFFLTGGVAAAIGYIAVKFLYSIMV